MPREGLLASLLVFSSYVSATLTGSEKTGIVQKHNDLRAAIATPCTATDMETMVWDDTLAAESQTYADQCIGDHASGAGSQFGENLWMLTSGSTYTSADIVGAVQEWYDEIKDVEWIKNANGDYAEAKSKAGSSGCESPDTQNGNCFIGHFTQVVWAKSNKVGCGVKGCSPMSVSGQQYSNGAVLVCRYTPAGNSAASANANHLLMPFVAGTKCAACSGSCSTAGLCDTGSTPTRCADKNPPYALNGVSHQTCADYVGAVSAMLGQTGLAACTNEGVASMITGFCDLTCSKCSVPSGVGSSHCSLGVTATATTLATTTKTAGPTVTGPSTTQTVSTVGPTAHSTTKTDTTIGQTTTVSSTTPAVIVVMGSLFLSMSAAHARKLVQEIQGPSAQKVKDALAESLALHLEGISRQDIEILGVTLSLRRRLGEIRRLVGEKAKIDYNIRIHSGSSIQEVAAKVIAMPQSAFVSTANSKLGSAGVSVQITTVDLPIAPTAATTTLGPAATTVSPGSDSNIRTLSIIFVVWFCGLLILGMVAAVIYKFCCRAHSDTYNLSHSYQREEATEIPKDNFSQEEGQKEELPPEEVNDVSANTEPTALVSPLPPDVSLIEASPPPQQVTQVPPVQKVDGRLKQLAFDTGPPLDSQASPLQESPCPPVVADQLLIAYDSPMAPPALDSARGPGPCRCACFS